MRLFIDALLSRAGKGLTSWLSFVMSNCGVVTLGQVWCLIVSIPDICPFSYLHMIDASFKIALRVLLHWPGGSSELQIINLFYDILS